MSKVVQAINAMVSKQRLIHPVIRKNDEYFFVYNGKHKWSLSKYNDDDYTLYYYPVDLDIEQLATLDGYSIQNIDMVVYNQKEIGTRESKASFAELYSVLSERAYGMTDVFDDIIGSSDDLPF